MIWNEILINKDLPIETIINFIKYFFKIELSDIIIVNDIEGLPSQGNIKIAIVKQHIKGDFNLYLSIYVYDEKLIYIEKDLFCIELSKALNVDCLVSDESVNPYTMVLFSKGIKSNVDLDEIRLSEYEEYKIKK